MGRCEKGGICHNDKSGQETGNGRERSVGWSYFLLFPLTGGAKTAGGEVDARSSLLFMFASTFALSLFALTSTFVRTDVAKEMIFKEGGEISNVGSKKLIFLL